MTAVREHKRRAGRYVVEVAGEAVMPVAVETIAELDIRTGRVLDAADLARLLDARAATACTDQALDALARRSRATGDLERWLSQREHARPAIAVAVERLTALGLLDDERFARAFVTARTDARIGPRRIERELRGKGVSSADVSRVMAEFRETGADGEADLLAAAAERRHKALKSLEPTVARRRLVGWLVRRGFDASAAWTQARRLISAD